MYDEEYEAKSQPVITARGICFLLPRAELCHHSPGRTRTRQFRDALGSEITASRSVGWVVHWPACESASDTAERDS